MRVLQLTKHYPPYFGGVESVTYDLTEGLNKRGIQCDVICANDHFRNVTTLHDSYTVYRAASMGKLFSTSISPSIIKVLKERWNKYDIIHVHCPDPITTLALFLVKPKAIIVVHWHSDIIKQRQLLKLYLPLQNWLLRRADSIIGTTSAYIAYSPQLSQFQDKTVCIPIGVSDGRMKVSASGVQEIRSKHGSKRIVFGLGRLIYYKGFEYLIEAAKYLPEDVVILIGGTGVLNTALQHQIDILGLSERVKLMGRIEEEDLGNYFTAADIFCLPSVERSEAFGVVLLEAMQMQTPIIATQIVGSGVSSVNQENRTGINVPVRDSKALAEAIMRLLNNKEAYNDIVSQSRQHFLENYTDDKMVENVINLYNSLLKRTSS